MSWIAAGAGVLTAGLGIVRGIKQKKEGQALLDRIKNQEVPAAVLENQRIARNMAAEGMPSEQYAMAKREIDRNNMASIVASNNRRGGLAIIPRVLQSANDAYLRLNAQNAQMRNQNMRNLIGVNSQVGAYQNQKYQADYNYGNSLIGSGNDNIYGAVDTALSSVGGGLSDYLRSNKNLGSTSSLPSDPTIIPSARGANLDRTGMGIDTSAAMRRRRF